MKNSLIDHIKQSSSSDCVEEKNRNFSLDGGKTKLQIVNNAKVLLIKIDPHYKLLDSKQRKCDFMIYKRDFPFVFVESKGKYNSESGIALEQLKNTIRHFGQIEEELGIKPERRIAIIAMLGIKGKRSNDTKSRGFVRDFRISNLHKIDTHKQKYNLNNNSVENI